MTDNALPLFYKTLRVLHPAAHGNHSLATKASYRFAAQTNAVPVVADEMMLAGRHFPLVFSDDAKPYPVAVLGLRARQNLFIGADGQWRAGVYLPAYLRRYPFIFLEHAASQDLTLCVDEAAESLVAGRDNPLFDAKGEPTPLTASALALCRDYQAQHLATADFARAVVEADLLVEHRADVTLRDGRALSLSGFKVIDQDRFMHLPDETFLAWRRKGWLALVHWHFFSIGAWSALIDEAAAQA